MTSDKSSLFKLIYVNLSCKHLHAMIPRHVLKLLPSLHSAMTNLGAMTWNFNSKNSKLRQHGWIWTSTSTNWSTTVRPSRHSKSLFTDKQVNPLGCPVCNCLQFRRHSKRGCGFYMHLLLLYFLNFGGLLWLLWLLVTFTSVQKKTRSDAPSVLQRPGICGPQSIKPES